MTGLLDARKVLDLFEQGASVVLQGLQRYWPPLTDLCAELEAELGHPCQANAYLTPPGSQGFAVHSDSHDVFVFQTHGTKLWEVHERRRAPRGAARARALDVPPDRHPARRPCPGDRVAARDDRDQPADLARPGRPCRPARARGRRRHLPAGYPDEPGLLADGLAARLERLAAALREVDVEAAAAEQVRRFSTGRPSRLRGGLRDRLVLDGRRRRHAAAAPARSPDAAGDRRRRPGRRAARRPHGDVPGLGAPGPRGAARPARPGARRPHRPRPAEPVVLCRRLVREGLLEVVG